MSFVHRARRAAALLAVLAVGACSDSTAPTIDNIDALAASAKLDPVLGVMQQGAMNSFASLSERSELPSSASAAALGAVAQLTTTAARGRPDASAPLLARAVARSADVIPPEARGMLYTYNETTAQYEGAPSAEAPSNGIRIILYAVNPLTWQISSPLTPIGHVNLLDESTSQQDRLHVEVVANEGNVELMDYAITHSVTTSSESFSIVGTARNMSGTTPVSFDLSGTASETAATATFVLTASSVGFSVSESVNANMVTGQATVSVELGYDGHTLSFTITVSETSISGEIRYDDKRYATLSVTFDPETGEVTSSSFLKANGRPFTLEELDAISNVFNNALDFDDFWAGLLWPVGALAPTV